MEVLQPGSCRELDQLLRQRYKSGNPTYYRLSDHPHAIDLPVTFGKGVLIRDAAAPVTVATAGPLLGNVMIKDAVLRSFAGKNVLVTGGTGLIGRQVVAMLADAGANVRIVSLDHLTVHVTISKCYCALDGTYALPCHIFALSLPMRQFFN